MKNNKGITLIALVITIIVLVILAGVTIAMIINEDGIVRKSKYCKERYARSRTVRKNTNHSSRKF